MPRFTRSEVRKVEETFNLTLPGFYADFLVNHDERLEFIEFEAGLLGQNQLMTDVALLICTNEEIRSPDLRYFGEHSWPNVFFVIGMDGCGCHYFVDTLGKHPGILLQDIYDWDIHPIAGDCYDLIKRLQWEEE